MLGNINPLNILSIREVKNQPPHFKYTVINYMKYHRDISKIKEWINDNLYSRFCIHETLELINNTLETNFKIGFEDKGDMTIFLLSCPYLNK